MGILERVPAPAMRWLGRQQFRPVLGPVVKASTGWLRNRPRVVAHGQAAGLRIDPAGANAGYALGTTEPVIQDVFAEHVPVGGVVWDIGANIGFFSLIASRLVGSGEVFAFEPLPRNLQALARNLALNDIHNVSSVAVALSDEPGRADLQVLSSQTWAKLDTSPDTAFQEELDAVAHVEVEVSTIDLQLQRLPAPGLVKIDIEGAETAALRGAAELLSKHRPTLICEVHGTNEGVSDLLESYGYKLQAIETPELHPRQAGWNVHVLALPA
jgi:FkbM family methyltransferase